MNTLDYQYLWLLRKIKEDGYQKEGRNGWTRSIFGYQITHDMQEGFPLLTTKKMWFKGIRTELEWFLNGDTNIQYLVKQGNNIWVGDAYKNYCNYDHYKQGKVIERTESTVGYEVEKENLSEKEFIERIKTDDEFAKKWGDMGPIYGKQWRKWYSDRDIGHIDQIDRLISDINEKPDSRRLMVNAWNVGDLDRMVLPPCHYGFQVWTRKLTLEERANAIPKLFSDETLDKYMIKGSLSVNDVFNNEYVPKRGISLLWNQRSVDTPLGLPFNIASYGLLLEMIADEVMMLPLDLIGNLGDTHIYENQLEGVEEQLKREDKIHELPEIHVRDGIYSRGEEDIFFTKEYTSEPKIEFPLSN